MAKDQKKTTNFPAADKGTKGYSPQQVDSFLDDVKLAFENPQVENSRVTSKALRAKSFDMKRNGYDPRYVDAALDRLEELFYQREKTVLIAKHGRVQWDARAEELGKEIAGRISLPHTERFKRTNLLAHGYNLTQVDAVLDQISTVLGRPNVIKTSQIRQVRFHAQRKGYDEAQVDAFLDAVIEFLLAIKK